MSADLRHECLPAAWGCLEAPVASSGFEVFVSRLRHGAALAETLAELPDLRGNVRQDVQTAVLKREHGVSRIGTHTSDFRRCPFLNVLDPLGEG